MDGSELIVISLLMSEFFTLSFADAFLVKSEWQQVSSTLLSILADLINEKFGLSLLNLLVPSPPVLVLIL